MCRPSGRVAAAVTAPLPAETPCETSTAAADPRVPDTRIPWAVAAHWADGRRGTARGGTTRGSTAESEPGAPP